MTYKRNLNRGRNLSFIVNVMFTLVIHMILITVLLHINGIRAWKVGQLKTCNNLDLVSVNIHSGSDCQKYFRMCTWCALKGTHSYSLIEYSKLYVCLNLFYSISMFNFFSFSVLLYYYLFCSFLNYTRFWFFVYCVSILSEYCFCL